MSLEHSEDDPVAERDAEYELAQAQDAQALALARLDRARQEQSAAEAAGCDQPCEQTSLTR